MRTTYHFVGLSEIYGFLDHEEAIEDKVSTRVENFEPQLG